MSLVAAHGDPWHTARAREQPVLCPLAAPSCVRCPPGHANLLSVYSPRLCKCLDIPFCADSSAARAAKCPFSILLQHHCPLPPQLRQEQQRRRRQQAAAAGGDAAATAAGGAGGQALPSQGALLQQAMRGGQRPAAGTRAAGTAGTAGEAPLSVDTLMDELFSDEAGPAQAAGMEEAGGAAAPPPCMEELMDELFELEQEATGHPGPTERARKRPRLQPAAALAVDAAGAGNARAAGDAGLPAGPASVPVVQQSADPLAGAAAGTAAAAGAGAAGGQSSRSLPSTQPAPQHAGTLPQPQPGGPPLAACFVPHHRVAAFLWASLRAIVPAALLGDARNRRVLRGAIRRVGHGALVARIQPWCPACFLPCMQGHCGCVLLTPAQMPATMR